MKKIALIFALSSITALLCAGCITLPEKSRTEKQDDINAVRDAAGIYPETRGLKGPSAKVAKPVAAKPVVATPKPQAKPAANKPPEGGLMLYYSFERVSLDGKVPDESGNGHDGTVFGATQADDADRGKVFYFNGVNNYVLAGNIGKFPSGTISFWMKAEEVRNWRNPFTTDYANWDACIRFEESTDEKFCIGALGLGAGFFTTSLKPMTWHLVTYAWDDKTAYGYLDGKAVFTINHPDPGTSVHPNIANNAGYWKEQSLNFRNVAIGNGYSSSPERYWKGWIDDVRIYDRPLSGGEVSALYSSAPAKPAAKPQAIPQAIPQARPAKGDLLVWYDFEKDFVASGIVEDRSGNGNNAKIIGKVSWDRGIMGKKSILFVGAGYIQADGNPAAGRKEVTFSFWFKTDDPGANYKMASAAWWRGGPGCGWIMATHIPEFWSDDTKSLYLPDQTNVENHFPAGKWIHEAVTYDGSRIKEYTNGKLVNDWPSTGAAIGAGEPMAVGAWPQFTAYNFRGAMDDFRIYGRALSPREIMIISLRKGR